MSVLIQVGYDTEDIKHSLGRVNNGERASIIGVMADLLHDETSRDV